MKPEEIQLGDWLRYEYTEGGEEEGEIEYYEYDFRVNQIYFGMGTQEVSGEDGDIYDIADVQPIPITPEILEKNGFNKIFDDELRTTLVFIKETTKIYNTSVEISLYKEPIAGGLSLVEINTCPKNGEGLNRIHVCDILHVHELQHSLRLCGIEKEIIL